mgnify:CR=1 FL=1
MDESGFYVLNFRFASTDDDENGETEKPKLLKNERRKVLAL